MSLTYRTFPPESPQPLYFPSTTVTIKVAFPNYKAIPGSFKIIGLAAFLVDGTAGGYAYCGDATRMFIDGPAGINSIIGQVTVDWETLGTVEKVQEYARLCHVRNRFGNYDESLGTESRNAVGLVCPSDRTIKGMIQGLAGGTGVPYPNADGPLKGAFVPFAEPLKCCLNRASAPFSSDPGILTVTIDLLAPSDVMYGEDFVATSSYVLADLRLGCNLMSDDGKRQDIVFETRAVTTTPINTAEVTYSTNLPTPCRSVTTTFINLANRYAQGLPKLVCQPPYGLPPYGYDQSLGAQIGYGIERLRYSINDVDDEIVDFEFNSQAEILTNGLKAQGTPPSMWGGLYRKMRHPVSAYRDGYIAGIDFGGLMRFGQGGNTFSYTLQSACDAGTNNYIAINEFKAYKTIKA